MRLLRYIHRNPVRAGIVSSSEDYQWSSHNAYIKRNVISWINTNFGLSKFANPEFDQSFEYNKFVSEMEDEDELKELRSKFKDGYIFGDDDFVNFVKNQNANQESRPLSIESIMSVGCDEFKIKKDLIASKDKSRRVSFARGVICKIGMEEGDISLTALGRLFNRDQSTISRVVDGLEKKYKEYAHQYLDIEAIKDLLFQTKTT